MNTTYAHQTTTDPLTNKNDHVIDPKETKFTLEESSEFMKMGSSSLKDSSDVYSNDGDSSDYSWSQQGSPTYSWKRRASSSALRVDQRTSEIRDRLSFVNQSPVLKRHKTVQQLTINKLRYESIGLVGREREIETLRSCLTRIVMGKTRRKELVFIKGYSGVGKTSLAYTLEKSVIEMKRGIFVRGKFDSHNDDEPYAGIAAAFGEICRRIKALLSSEGMIQEQGLIEAIGNTILSELGSEVHLLSKLIPELDVIIPSIRRSSDVSNESHDFHAGAESFKYAFRILTRALSSYFAPMVLVFDDLQWADVSSLKVIDFLISDVQNPTALMIIGCFRSNEVNIPQFLSSRIQNLTEKKEQFRFNMTDIELGSLGVVEVNRVIMAMLSIDDEDRTRALAETCFKRSLGNPFFLIEFVTMLEDEDLISFNLGALDWVWDEKLIDNETMSTANVVDLVQARIRKLPESVQLLLQYAACLGSSFQLSTLSLIWNMHAMQRSSHTMDLTGLLVSLTERDFVESCGVGMYRWVHDKVKETALTLGDAAQASFQFEIGSILYHGLSHEDMEDNLFDVVNLINKGNATGRPEFAELNLRAAEEARSISAFHSAAVYASNGIELLPTDKWKTHHALTLHLYTVGAEMALALGRVEEMEKYSNEVLSGEGSLRNKLPLYMIKSHKLCNVESKYEDSISLCLDVLKELGFKIARNRITLPLKAIASLLLTVQMARKIPKEDYRTPKIMTDPIHRATVLFLSRLFYSSYHGGNKFLLLLSATSMIRMTIKYGVSPMSGTAYAALGLLTASVLKDFRTASEFAETALLIQKLSPSKYTESITMFTAFHFILPWTQPMQSCMEPLLYSYSSGLRSGNTSYAMWSLMIHHISIPFHMGKPLPSIEKKCSVCSSQIKEVNQVNQEVYTNMLWQMILNLRGVSENPVVLKGTAFDCEEYAPQTHAHSVFLDFVKNQLFVFFGEFNHVADFAVKHGNEFEKTLPSNVFGMMETFHRGVALYAMARQTKKRKFVTHANRVRRTLQAWVKKGNPNVQHYYRLLCAEQAALDGRCRNAEVLYKSAIVLAGRTGHLHNAALFSERYADFLNREGSHIARADEEAKYRIEEAIRFYNEWGAEAKVQILLKIHS
jgi:predicted ATPase